MKAHTRPWPKPRKQPSARRRLAATADLSWGAPVRWRATGSAVSALRSGSFCGYGRIAVITVETKDDTPNQFEWSESAKGFERLWEHCEESAGDRGIDLSDMMAAAIQSKLDGVAAVGQAAWGVYAVLRVMARALDVSGMADEAGILVTTFDLAARQTIKATVRPD